ncbi:MAG: hypothetical protein FD165_647 [Gammaproteobacteria bacterium]|nr:MAG: hypothetical protein FD165_647 [Gammaproteobacteria bacterium]TND02089.1 MAG: hypothetical protein FD120_2253 [Gammaproteobacteria bacterium]
MKMLCVRYRAPLMWPAIIVIITAITAHYGIGAFKGWITISSSPHAAVTNQTVKISEVSHDRDAASGLDTVGRAPEMRSERRGGPTSYYTVVFGLSEWERTKVVDDMIRSKPVSYYY